MSEFWTYAKAGVDLDKHREMHKQAHEVISRVLKVMHIELEHGFYSNFVRLGNYRITLHSDGVGTKSIIAQEMNRLDVAGWDAVAMNVNDVVVDGAKPLVLVDYLALPKSDPELVRQVLKGIEDACRYANVLLLGGETAIMPDLVNYVDVSCTVLAVKLFNTEEPTKNDIVIGVESSGLHANGYTLVRKSLLSKYSLSDYIPEIEDFLGNALLKPTIIYSNLILELYERKLIKVAAHITGGAYTKLKRILPSDLDIIIEPPEPPRIFKFIQKVGNIDDYEMYRVFNMGIGMIVITSEDNTDHTVKVIERNNLKAFTLGKILEGSGKVRIKLKDRELVYS